MINRMLNKPEHIHFFALMNIDLENMYLNSFYDKMFLCYGLRACFRLWPTAAILEFKIQLLSLNISFFSIAPRSFYIEWDLGIMIY